MKEETVTLTNLVHHLVNLARLDEEAPLQMKSFDLAQAVWDTASIFAPAGGAPGRKAYHGRPFLPVVERE